MVKVTAAPQRLFSLSICLHFYTNLFGLGRTDGNIDCNWRLNRSQAYELSPRYSYLRDRCLDVVDTLLRRQTHGVGRVLADYEREVRKPDLAPCNS